MLQRGYSKTKVINKPILKPKKVNVYDLLSVKAHLDYLKKTTPTPSLKALDPRK